MDPQYCIYKPLESNVNYNELCRLCGCKTQEKTRFNIFEGAGVLLKIKNKIISCLQLNTNEYDILPKVACFQCIQTLENFHSFKVNCEKTNESLLNLIHTGQFNSNVSLNNFVNEPECIISTSEIEIKTEKPDPLLLYNEQPSTSSVFKAKVYMPSTSIVKLDPSTCKTSRKRKVKQKKSEDLQCDFCSKVFPSRVNIAKHIKRQHVDTYKQNVHCKICNKKLKDNLTLKVHIRVVHKKEYKFMCEICGSGFLVASILENHIRVTHNKERNFKCQHCDQSFGTKYTLKAHFNNKHNNELKVKCDYCEKIFRNKHQLKIHRIKHEIPIHERNKHKCVICYMGFQNTTVLRRHVATVHGGERPYKCDECDKCYSSSGSLQVHKLTHTGERKHVCEVCGRAFALLNTLKDHRESVHEGLKNYKCADCDKSYTQRKNLNIHLKKTGHTKIKQRPSTLPCTKKQ